MNLRTTHIYATLEISPKAFKEIWDRIKKLGPDYSHYLIEERGEPKVIHWGGDVGLVSLIRGQDRLK
jgi:mannosyltransferase OCH1-like enzyme